MNRYHVAFSDAATAAPGPALFVDAASPTDALNAALYHLWGGSTTRNAFDLIAGRGAPKTGTTRRYMSALACAMHAPSAFLHFTCTEISRTAIGEHGALCTTDA